MKKSMYIFILSLIAILLLAMLTAFTFSLEPKEKEIQQNEKQYNPKFLYDYLIDPHPEDTKSQAFEEYKICPPLKPERFQRRIKIMSGIDINDYPDNSLIILNSDNIVISKKYQLILNLYEQPDYSPFLEPSFTKEDYIPFRQYIYYNDLKSFQKIQEIKEEWIKKLDNKAFPVETRIFSDLLYLYYNTTIFSIDEKMIEYLDQNANNSYRLLPSSDNQRVSDVRFDFLNLYIAGQNKKGREITYSGEKNGMQLGISLIDVESSHSDNLTPKDYISGMASYNFDPQNGNLHKQIWQNYTAEKGICAYLSFLLRLKDKVANKLVIQFMSGQIDRNLSFDWLYNDIRANIRENNYYGYAVLREFCENPMREMPTLEKIGNSFTAKVKEENTLLLLEPYADSFDIDTIQPIEILKAYEMGYDDYYFIEIEKPVESPVADKDGYAMILDRTETVYGYIPKSQVEAMNSQKVLKESKQ